jgi:anti-sigma B factor antagonist
MDIKHSKEGEIAVITIKGRLDADTAPVADKTIKKILEGNCLRMLFDFSALDYLGSGGLRVILGATKELRRKEGQVVLCCLSNFVKEIFLVSGLNSAVPIADSFESGIEQLGGKSSATVHGFWGGAPPFGLGASPYGFDPTGRPHKQRSAQPLAA